MIKVTINDGDGERDYTAYVGTSSIEISRTLNAPSTCTFTLTNNDNNFILPVGMSYVKIWSTEHNRYVFTGYIQNDPSRSFLGTGMSSSYTGFQKFTFKVNCTSDEYLLNIKYVPLLPAFVNQYQGYILQSIAEAVCPGMYDFTYCEKGDLIPYLAYDPKKAWSEYAKQFCDASRYRYNVIDHQIRFLPYGDGKLGIDYNEEQRNSYFDPKALSTSIKVSPPVNDVTIVGNQEAGNCREDFFIGTGFEGSFPLKHKIFGLASAQVGGGILLSDEWSNTSVNTQNWNAVDPTGSFNYGLNDSQALNVITGEEQVPGTSYISAQAALELAGGLTLQHGEIVFNDSSSGTIGGLYGASVLQGYNQLALDESSCLAAFKVSPTASVSVTISGASGISLQPTQNGVALDNAFNIITEINKSYVMSTKINAPAASRYNQVYRTLSGSVYGGTDTKDVIGSITWSVVASDLFTGVQTTYTYTLANQTLPATAIYVLLDNYRLNLTLTSTNLTAPIPGNLAVRCQVGSGALSPIYVSGNVQYVGGFVTPSGGNLPIPPGQLAEEQIFSLGTSLQNQAAELDSGQLTDTLNFYGDDIPGVGTRIKLQTFESQAAIARVRAPDAITAAAAIVGDDGIRAALVTDLAPLPRTSEDCENAALAFLEDRAYPRYEGSYEVPWLYMNQFSDDLEYYPSCGRFFTINAPSRNIINTNFLVSAVTTKISELFTEQMTHNISFGPDMALEKLLAALVPTTDNLLTPLDTTVAPTPQEIGNVGYTYMPDVLQATVLGLINGDTFTLQLTDDLPAGAQFEVRTSNQNWGISDKRLLARTSNGLITIPRTGFDEIFWIRIVSLTSATPVSSRRSKGIRIQYPRVPAIPSLTSADSLMIKYDFSGDLRNIEGIELLSQDLQTVYYRAIVGSEFDTQLQLSVLNGTSLNTNPLGLGQYMLNKIPEGSRDFAARFFNLMWEYSEAQSASIPLPNKLNINEGYRFGSALQILVSGQTNRTDIKSTRLEIFNTQALDSLAIAIDQAGFVSSFITNVPVTGDLWARAVQFDYISSGNWSDLLHIPRGNLIASDYLAGQGSIPPSVTSSLSGSGGIFSYIGHNDSIELIAQSFAMKYPNGYIDQVPATDQTFTTTVDTNEALQIGVQYGFFPVLANPTTPSPTIQFRGPYLNYMNTAALASQFLDGSVPLTNGVLITQTAYTATGESGGGGGGTYGGGNCGEISRKILLSDGRRISLKDLKVGDYVANLAGRVSRVVKKEVKSETTYYYKTNSGLDTETALGHVIYTKDEWKTLETALEDSNVPLYLWTEKAKKDLVVSITDNGLNFIAKIALEPTDISNCSDLDHVYNLDGIWTHNFLIKDDGNYN